MSTSFALHGAGLGLRRSLLPELLNMDVGAVDFLECAPDNWIGVGGAYGESLARLAERFPLSCHGLSLSLGGPEPLDHEFLRRIRAFLDQHDVPLFSEHLSYCSDDGHLYDLIPMPFTDEAVRHTARRIREVQDALGRRIAVENISYYAAPYQAMSEIDFLCAVLNEADCDLLLDINNRSSTPATTVTTLTLSLPVCQPGGWLACMWPVITMKRLILRSIPTVLRCSMTSGNCCTAPTSTWGGADFAGARFQFPPLAELLGEVEAIRMLQVAAQAPEVRHG